MAQTTREIKALIEKEEQLFLRAKIRRVRESMSQRLDFLYAELSTQRAYEQRDAERDAADKPAEREKEPNAMLSPQWDEQTLATLETLIAQSSMHEIVGILAEISRKKADDSRANWQDDTTADSWIRVAGKLDGLSSYITG